MKFSDGTLKLQVQTQVQHNTTSTFPRKQRRRQTMPENISSDLLEERLSWVINSFSPYKPADLGRKILVMMQKQQDGVIPWLVLLTVKDRCG